MPANVSALAPALATPAADAHCFHCGLENPPGRRWTAIIGTVERGFCCAGCVAVAQTIHDAGLDGFYAARTALLARPETAESADEWARHEDAAVAAGLVRTL